MAREEEWTVQLLNWDDEYVRDLTEFTGGSIEFNYAATIQGSGTIDVTFKGDGARAVSWGSARLKIWYSPNVGVWPTPMGVFLVSTPTWSYNDDLGVSSATINIMDKLTVLNQDTAGGAYSAPANSVVTTLVQQIIESSGEEKISVIPSVKTLKEGLVWAADATKLQIVNDLLDTINYQHLWCDRNGYFRVEPYVSPTDRAVTFTFDRITPRYLPAWQRDNDWYDVPNRVVLVTQGSDTEEALTSVITDVDSRYSYSARGGRWITLTETGVEAADQATLDALARRRLQSAQYRASNLVVTHVMEPDVWLNDRVAFTNEITESTAVVHKWSVGLTPGSLVQATWLEVTQLAKVQPISSKPLKVSRRIKWNTLSNRAPLATSRGTSWQTLQQVLSLRITSWNVAGWNGKVSATRDIRWKTRHQVSASRGVVWNVFTTNTIHTLRSLGWTTRARVFTSRLLAWNVLSNLSSTDAWPGVAYPGLTYPGYILTPYPVGASRAVGWRVLQQVSASRATTWNVNTTATVSTSRGVLWTTRQKILAQRTLTWNTTASTWSSTLFGTGTPAGLQQSDPYAYNLGTVIRVLQGGTVTKIRFYMSTPHDTFTTTVRLYVEGNTTAVREATQTWTIGTPAGWVEVPITPYAVQTNQVVMAAYTISGYYVAQNTGLAADVPSADGRLVAPTSVTFNGTSGNGRYSVTTTAIPDQVYQQSNYYVDLTLEGSAGVQPVGTSRSTLWNVASNVNLVSATRNVLWQTAAYLAASKSTTWNVAEPVAGGAPAFVAASTTIYSTRQYVTISNPTNLQVDDLILVQHLVGGAGTPSAPVTVPTGFQVLAGPDSLVDNGGFTVHSRLYYKWAVVADAGATPANTAWEWAQATAGESVQGIALVYRGVNKATPMDVAVVANPHAYQAGSGNTYNFTGLTTANDNTMVVALAHDWGTYANNLTPPTGFTERADLSIMYAADKVLTTAGPTGAVTMTNNNTSADAYCTYLLALRPLNVAAETGSITSVNWTNPVSVEFTASGAATLRWGDGSVHGPLNQVDPASSANVQPNGLVGRTLIMSEEFNGASVTVVDAPNGLVRFRANGPIWGAWYPDPSMSEQSGHSNNVGVEKEWYAISGLSLGAGSLTLTATLDHQHDAVGLPYTSGLIQSNGFLKVTKGFFEIRMKTSDTAGAWPAFWILPASYTWPPEVDIMDATSGLTGYQIRNFGPGSTVDEWYTADIRQWHTYGLDFDGSTGLLKWYLDGTLIATEGTPGSVPNEPMYLVANLAVTAAAVAASLTTDIDYIRVWGTGSEWESVTSPASHTYGADGQYTIDLAVDGTQVDTETGTVGSTLTVSTSRSTTWNVASQNWSSTIYGTSIPAEAVHTDDYTSYNLGTVIRCNEAGTITKLRFLVIAPHDPWTSTVRLYLDDNYGPPVREVTWAGWDYYNPSQWVEVDIEPYAVTAGQTVMVAYTIPGYYASQMRGLEVDVVSPDTRLTAPTSVTFNGVNSNGRYTTTLTDRPDQVFNNTNYFTDLVLEGVS